MKPEYGYYHGGDIISAEDMKRSFLSRGLEPTTGRRCIRRLAGLRCTINDGSYQCDCLHPLWDHTELYLKHGKPCMLVTQPYYIGSDDLAALLGMCSKYSLEVSITGHSWYFPGQALLIVITNKEDRGSKDLLEIFTHYSRTKIERMKATIKDINWK